MLGPSTRWPTTGDTTRDAADGWWAQAEPGDCFADEVSGGYDADGDGLDDLLVNGAQFAFVPGRTTTLLAESPIRDETWFEGEASWFSLLPDMDGDGLAEAAVMPTIDLRNYGGFIPVSLLQDGASGIGLDESLDVVSLGEYNGIDFFPGRSELGDVDGDGLTDVAVEAFRDVNADGQNEECSAVLFGSTSLRTDDLDQHLDRLVCVDHYSAAYADPDRITDDTDGDGIRDVLINEPYTGGMAAWQGCVIASTRRPSTGWEMLEDVRSYCFDTGGTWDMAGAVIDLDGDGLPEIIGSDLAYSGSRGEIVVSPGFGIPFTDDSRW